MRITIISLGYINIMSSGVVMGFSPNDFFYVRAEENNRMPTNSECNNLSLNPPENCDINSSEDCVRHELCKNQSKVNVLYNLQNKHGGFDQKHEDGKSLYNDTILTTFNLGTGIVIALAFIYTKYIYKPKL
jgi:hypothetical protein